MRSIRLRGWLVRYLCASYEQRRFIEGAKRDIRKLVQGPGSRVQGTGIVGRCAEDTEGSDLRRRPYVRGASTDG